MGLPWFFQQQQGQKITINDFQLDIVGFLAILGEGSVETLAQVVTLSNFTYLPRLVPAPQIFLKPARPEKFESTSNAKVAGVYSGNTSEEIHYVAHALHRGDKLEPNTVTCVHVTEDELRDRPSPKRYGPLALLAVIGFLLSAGLFAASLARHDAFALIATVLLSLLSTNTGIANKWSPTPNNPQPDPHSPPGDVVIKYSQGAFIIVKCEERTARYLYFNPSERCIYQIRNTAVYRGLSLVSTLLLMGGVIALANASTTLQVGFAGAYILINVFYWIGAALPPASHWDLSRLKVNKVELRGGHPRKGATVDNVNPSHTEALWKIIAVTGKTDWLLRTGWTPNTEAWKEWFNEAEEAALSEPMRTKFEKQDGEQKEVWQIKNWDPKHALSTILRTKTESFNKLGV